MTNHKNLIDVTVSLVQNCLYLEKRGILKIDQSVKMPLHRLCIVVACSNSSAPGVAKEIRLSFPFVVF